MADLTLTIPLPILIGAQQFKVEYRAEGAMSWTLWGYEDNSVFTITGLTENQTYEVRYTLVESLSPLVECDPVINKYFVPGEIPCITGVSTLVQDGDLWYLSNDFTFPSPYVPPCGGYKVIYGVGSNLSEVDYPVLTDPLVLPASYATYNIWVYALDCYGSEALCFQNTVTPPEIECEDAVITNAILEYVNNQWRIKLTVTPSDPATTYGVTYQQANNVNSGIPDPGGSYNFNSTNANPEIFYIPVIPNFDIVPQNGLNRLVYEGALTDNCNTTHPFVALQCCPQGYVFEDGQCVLVIRTRAVLDSDLPSFTAAKKSLNTYAVCGSSIYSSFNPDGTGVFTDINTSYWENNPANTVNGPFNRTAIWNSSGDGPLNVWVTVGIQVNVSTAKTYYIGIGADNIARVRLNCDDLLQQDINAMYAQRPGDPCLTAPVDVTFKIWNIYPVSLVEGSNFLEVACMNTGGAGAFGFQIYDNTSAEIIAATSDGDLNIVVSSEQFVGQTIDGFRYSCPGEECNTVVFENGEYWCYERRVVESTCE